MKTIKLKNQEIKLLAEDYDWKKATDGNDKKLFSTENEFNSATMERIFSQFDLVEITEDDQIYGVYSNEQKILISKAPYIFDLVKELKETTSSF